MRLRSRIIPLIVTLSLWVADPAQAQAPKSAARSEPPTGALTVAVATFGNERWLPHLYVGAEDVVLKPMYENLLNRDPATGALIPMLAERWESLEGGLAWRLHLRQGVAFHDGQGELTAEDVKFTFTAIMQEGSANGLAPEFRLIRAWKSRIPIPL